MSKRILRLSLLCAGIGILLHSHGCGGPKNKVRIAGSTSLFPFVEELGQQYEKTHPDAHIEIQAGGSTVGINSAHTGLADIGMASRSLTEEELKGVKTIEIARDGIAVIVHPSNKVDSLTTGQIRKIYSRKITNWKEVGGEDANIAAVTREEGSGTRGAFTNIVMGKHRISAECLVQNSNGSIREHVANGPESIGYISLALVNDQVKQLAVNGKKPSEENLDTGEYPLIRPFLFVVKPKLKDSAQSFIDFVLGKEGQKILKKEGLLGPASE